VPNFLEAQTRSKVARTSADMRSIRVAVESYRVDHNHYPETDTGETDMSRPGVGLYRVTTPVAYMTVVPKSPWREDRLGNAGVPKNANRENLYLWVRAETSPTISFDVSPQDGKDDNYNTDRAVYLGQGVLALNLAVRSQGEWELKSVGPNNIDDRDGNQVSNPADARLYDPTNGTISAGDIVVFSDQSGLARAK